MKGGSKLTVSLAQQHGKPYLHLDLKAVPLDDAIRMLASWLGDNGIRALNVAGSRASKDPEIYGVTVSLMESVLTKQPK